MRYGTWMVGAVLALYGAAVQGGTFVGTVSFTEPGCQNAGLCELAADFAYIDNHGYGWVAAKGNRTDGASIPGWAQVFVGYPFMPEYLNAAVLHDHYSKSGRPVYGWFQTQRMFYEALRDSGVPEIRASILYAGVLIGSRKWIMRMQGRPCEYGRICLEDVPQLMLETEPESYDSDRFRDAFARVAAEIEEAGEGLSLADVEALAMAESANPVYLENRSGVYFQAQPTAPYSVLGNGATAEELDIGK